MMLQGLPSFAIVELHPIILPILDFTGIFERLSKEFAQIVVIWSIFKAQVSDVAKVFVELLCHCVQFNIVPSRYNNGDLPG